MGWGRLVGGLLTSGAEKVATKGGKLSGLANAAAGIGNAFIGNNEKASTLGKGLFKATQLLRGQIGSSFGGASASPMRSSSVSSIEQESMAEANAANERQQTSILERMLNLLSVMLGVQNSQLDAIQNIDVAAGGQNGSSEGGLLSTALNIGSNFLGRRGLSRGGAAAARGATSVASKAGTSMLGKAGSAALKGLKLGGPLAVVGGLIEGGMDWADANERLAAGEITEREANVEKSGSVGKGLGTAGGALAGAAAGAAIGSVVPIVGTAIGGLIGGIAGAWLGGSGGEALGETVGDMIFEEEPEKAQEQIQQTARDQIEPQDQEETEQIVKTMTEASPQMQVAETLGMTKDGEEKTATPLTGTLADATEGKGSLLTKMLPLALGPAGFAASMLMSSDDKEEGKTGSLLGGMGKLLTAISPVAAGLKLATEYFKDDSEEKISESEKEKQIAEAETETQTISSLQDSISDMNENNTESSVTEREILETTTEQVSQQAPMNITNISAPKQKPQPIPSIPGRDNSGANADIGVGDSPESVFFMEFMSYMRRGYNIAKGIAN